MNSSPSCAMLLLPSFVSLFWRGFAVVAVLAVSVVADDAQRLEFFENRIRPVLVKHCYECHAANSTPIQAGLVVDTAAGLLKGGDTGPAIIPGDSS
ncbi:MAG: c-type cytochrome domain-containing protein, partial [Planctomycetaceae bacterium]